MAFISGLRMQCNACGSDAAPEVRNERWDGYDRVVVGLAVCRTCSARFLFTRFPTPDEAHANYHHGADIPPATTNRRGTS